MKKQIAIIAGAGPAGLTAAYELLKKTTIQPIVCEMTSSIGGISQTIKHNGNRMDLGGHRFFSKNQNVMDWWLSIMPQQTAPSKDELLLKIDKYDGNQSLVNPEKTDRVILERQRISRIFFLRKFFDYPISMKKETFSNMGLKNTLRAGFGYIWSCIHKLPEDSLENFYINRFGRPLYEMFFEDYTTKVWGVHPSKLGADWGSQRVKGLSIMAVIKDMLNKTFGIKKSNKNVETSLIEQFIYPKYGPGQLWEIVADEIQQMGGEIRMQCEVSEVHVENQQVKSVTLTYADGHSEVVDCDFFLSTMPIKNLVASIKGVSIPANIQDIASSLPYRDFITVGLCVDKLKIKNETKIKTYAGRIPDTWIYIQERDVKIGRLQVFNNWSPYLVKDYENTMWLGLEYFATEGDELWSMSSDEFINMAISELVKIDIIDRDSVKDACHVKIKKAYPAYYGSYYRLDEVKDFLNNIENLFCLGRNGQHRYNNMDHSMLTAMECVNNIKNGDIKQKNNIWNVNTEAEYHESK